VFRKRGWPFAARDGSPGWVAQTLYGGDTDVARMIARYTGASLGLLAFTIVIVSGVFAQNPITVTLSRSLFALFTFFVIGLVLGGAAQMVVNEHRSNTHESIERRYKAVQEESEGDSAAEDVVPTEGEAVSA